MGDQDSQERARYVIRIRGRLEPGWWSKQFEGFTVLHDETGNTLLSGEVVDRAAFYGLLSRARDLNLTIISVERRDSLEE